MSQGECTTLVFCQKAGEEVPLRNGWTTKVILYDNVVVCIITVRHSGAWEATQGGPSAGQGKSGTARRLKSALGMSVVIFSDVTRFAQRAHRCGAAMSDIPPVRHRAGLQAAPCHPSPGEHKPRTTGWLKTVQGVSGHAFTGNAHGLAFLNFEC